MPGHTGSTTQSYTDYPRSTVTGLEMTVIPPDKQDWIDATVAKLNGGHSIISAPKSRQFRPPVDTESAPVMQSVHRRNDGSLRYNHYCNPNSSGISRTSPRRINEKPLGLTAIYRINENREKDKEYDRMPYRGEMKKTVQMSFDSPLDRLSSPASNSSPDFERFERRMIKGQEYEQQTDDVTSRRQPRTRDNSRSSDLRFDPRSMTSSDTRRTTSFNPRAMTSSSECTGRRDGDYLSRESDISDCKSKNTHVSLSKSRLHEGNIVDSEYTVHHSKPYENCTRNLSATIKSGENSLQHMQYSDNLYNHTEDSSVKYRPNNSIKNDGYRDRRWDLGRQESSTVRKTSKLPFHQKSSFERNVSHVENASNWQPLGSDFALEDPSDVSYCADRTQTSWNRPRRSTVKDNADENTGNIKFDYFRNKADTKEKYHSIDQDHIYCPDTLHEKSPLAPRTAKERYFNYLAVNSGADQTDLFLISTDNTPTDPRLTPTKQFPSLQTENSRKNNSCDESTSIQPNNIALENNESETLHNVSNINQRRLLTPDVEHSCDLLCSTNTHHAPPIEVNIITVGKQNDCLGNRTKELTTSGLKKDLQGEDQLHSTNPSPCISNKSTSPCIDIRKELDVKEQAELSGSPVSPVSAVIVPVTDMKNEQITPPTALTTAKASSRCSASSIKTTGSSTRKSPFKVIYYQNRFISIPIGNRVGSSDEDGVLPTVVQCDEGVRRGLEDSELIKESTVHYDPSDSKATVSVDKRKNEDRLKDCLQRVVECLQDRDRTSVKRRRKGKVEGISLGSHTATFVKFLNLSFMITGLMLFFGVFFVIMYTSLKKYFI